MSLDFWLKHFDLYCERTDTTLFSEPINLFSNFAFYLAAFGMLYLSREATSPVLRRELRLLAWLAFTVGTGSALFHSFANRATQILDVVPIAIYVFVSLTFYLRNLWREGANVRTTLLFGAAALFLPVLISYASGLSAIMNSGDAYLGIGPALLTFAVLDKVPARRIRLGAASLLFFLALLFRTLDPSICDIFPYGTHFLWHLLTTICAYLMGSALAVTEPNSR